MSVEGYYYRIIGLYVVVHTVEGYYYRIIGLYVVVHSVSSGAADFR